MSVTVEETMPRERQRMNALTAANDRRSEMAKIRRQITVMSQIEGRIYVSNQLAHPDPAVGSMRVGHLLGSIHRMGEYKTRRLLKRAGSVSDGRRVQDLTPNQRCLISELLQEPMHYEEQREVEKQQRQHEREIAATRRKQQKIIPKLPILEYIASASGPVLSRDIADLVGAGGLQMSRPIQALSRQGLIEPVGANSRKKGKLWVLTDAGEQVVASAARGRMGAA